MAMPSSGSAETVHFVVMLNAFPPTAALEAVYDLKVL